MKSPNHIKIILLFLLGFISCSDTKECDDSVFSTSPVPVLFEFNFKNGGITTDELEIFCKYNNEIHECKNSLETKENSFLLYVDFPEYVIKTPDKEYIVAFKTRVINATCFSTVEVETIKVNDKILCENCNPTTIYTLE